MVFQSINDKVVCKQSMCLCVKLAVFVEAKQIFANFGKHLTTESVKSTNVSMNERTRSSNKRNLSSNVLSRVILPEPETSLMPPAL